MTTKRSYLCNICSSTMKDTTEGLGLKWDAGGMRMIQLLEAETHVCNKCLEGLSKLHKMVTTT